MSFFDFFKNKEVREEPTPQPTYTQALEHQSYCDVVQRQTDFIKLLRDKLKYDPLSISTVFACMNIISNNLAKIPWELKRDKEVINPIYLDTLLEESNLTSFMFIKQMILDVLRDGDGYAYINRDKAGKPISLRYLRHDQVIPFYNEQTDRLLYQIPILRKRSYIEPINVLHFIMNSKDGIEGRGVIQFAHNTVELSGYTDKAATEYFKNGMACEGIIKSAANLTDKARNQIRKGWKKLNLVFDYIGIPLYFLKVWTTKDDNIRKYRDTMIKLVANSGIRIEWLKVYSHTNIRINEVADQLAKIGSGVLEPMLDTNKVEQPDFIVKENNYHCVLC